MTIEYQVVSDTSMAGLKTKVESVIADGLVPIGGIAVDTKKIDPVFYQVLSTDSVVIPDLSQIDSTPQYPLGKIYTDEFGNEFMYVKNCTGATLLEYDMQGYTICGFNELGTTTIQSPDKDPSDNRMYFIVKTNNANYTYTQGDLEGLFVKVFNDDTEKLVTSQVIQQGNDVVTTEVGELVHRLYMPSSVAYNSSRELYIYSTGKGFLIRPNPNSTEYGMRTMYGAIVVHPCAEAVANGKYCWVYLGKTVHAAYS